MEILFFGYGYYLVEKEDAQTKDCYYNVCSNYEEAKFERGICYCYEKDLLGENYVVAKTKVIE